MTTLARLFPFFATARAAYSAVGAQVAPSPAAPAPVAEKPDPRVAELTAQLVDEHNREVRIARRVLKLEHQLVQLENRHAELAQRYAELVKAAAPYGVMLP